VPDPKLAAIKRQIAAEDKRYAVETKRTKRELRRGLLVIGVFVAAVSTIFGLAIAHDVRKAAECRARTCPGEQTPILIDVYCVCMTEATP